MFQNTPDPQNPVSWLNSITELIKIMVPVLALILSIINSSFLFWQFFYKDKKEDKDKGLSRNTDSFKKLILDPNLHQFYEFFRELETETKKLNSKSCTITDKKKIEAKTLELQINLRRNFVDILRVADVNLYDFTIEKIDDLIGNMNKSIFDGGINLTHKPMFEDKIMKPIADTRTAIIEKMFEYSGGTNNANNFQKIATLSKER